MQPDPKDPFNRRIDPAESTRRNLVRLFAAPNALSISRATLYRLISDGTITAYRLGPKLTYIDLDEVAASLKAVEA